MSVFEQVKQVIVKELNIDEAKVTLTADLKDDLGADSLDAVEVIMSLEDIFGITVDDSEAENIKTVEDIVKYIEARI